MDDISDDKLKEAFSPLRTYESPEPGITWASLINQIGETNSQSMLSQAIILICALIMLSSSPHKNNQAMRSVFATTECNSNEGHGVPQTNHLKRNDLSKKSNYELPFLRNVQTSEDVDRLGSVGFSLKTLRSSPSLIAEKQNFRVNEYQLQSHDNSNGEREAATKNELRKQIGLKLSVIYQFGVVNPIQTDNKVLHKYSATPGYGLGTELELPLSLWKKPFKVSFSYALIQKLIKFNYVQFGPETSNLKATKISPLTNIFSVGIAYPITSSWDITAKLNCVLGEMHRVTGRTSLTLAVQKPLVFRNANFYTGASAGIPLTGTIQNFKYYPLTVYFGYKLQ
jgi:hypothetical protein